MTPPPQSAEYCLLWFNWWATCHSKAEWASWFQAGGTLAAIVGAWMLARRDASFRRSEGREAAREELRARIATVKLGTEFLASYVEVAKQVAGRHPPPLQGLYDDLRMALYETMRVDPQEMPTQKAVVHLFRIRTQVRVVNEVLDETGPHDPVRVDMLKLETAVLQMAGSVSTLESEANRLV